MDNLIKQLLETKEWHNFECKRALVKPAKLMESVCAFVNNGGGMIVIGLEDPAKASGKDRLIGINEGLDNISDIFLLMDKDFEPAIKFWKKYEVDIVDVKNKPNKLLILSLEKSSDIHSLKKGDTFVRRGNQNIKINASEIIRLKYEKGSLKYEDAPSGITNLETIEDNLFQKFIKEINSKEEDYWQILKDNGLCTQTKNGKELTNAGALLFTKNPSVALRSKCGIKISHYFGRKMVGLLSSKTSIANLVEKPKTIEGPLLSQIERAMDCFNEIIKRSATNLDGATFKSSLLIPEWAFQEAVVNAVIHRNYSVQNDIQIRFYDDCIEIESPGFYPGHISPINIRTERFSRNPIILRTLNKFYEAPNMDIGEGVNRIFQVMKDNNLYDPIYSPSELRPNTVLLSLLNIRKIEQWDTVSKYLDEHHRISNKEARQITCISDTLKMTRLLSNWLEKGLLERRGKKKNSYYIKPSQKELDDLLQ